MVVLAGEWRKDRWGRGGGRGTTGEEVSTYELFMGHNQLLWLKTPAQFSGNTF